jgi:hypothetical protein
MIKDDFFPLWGRRMLVAGETSIPSLFKNLVLLTSLLLQILVLLWGEGGLGQVMGMSL